MTQLGTDLRKPSYEAVVVGTGFGGAVAACRLAQAGLDVAVLERGRRYPPGSFPRTISGRNGLLWERGEGEFQTKRDFGFSVAVDNDNNTTDVYFDRGSGRSCLGSASGDIVKLSGV